MRRVSSYLRFTAIAILLSVHLGFSQTNERESFREMESQILKLINEHRQSIGLNELKSNEDIHSEALKHSINMAKARIPFSHDGFDERYDRLMKRVGGSSMAENVAQGQTTAQEAIDSWLSSEGHKQNIEDNYNLTGIGIARGADGDLYFTQIFLLYKPTNK
jgi:uncharacterized protein YkwD